MARIIPNDFIKGITGKVCEHSDSYYSMNSTSGKIYTGKRCNPYTGPATETQLAQQAKFKAKALAATAWLNANKPDPTDSTDKGTDLYQEAQSLKKDYQLSNVRQVLYKYMDKDTNVIKLPSEGGTANSDSSSDSESSSNSGSSTTKYTLNLAASPSNGGTVSGAGSYAAGSTANISAVANSGYTFSQWSDGNTSASRSVTVNADQTLTAVFVASGSENEGGGAQTGNDGQLS